MTEEELAQIAARREAVVAHVFWADEPGEFEEIETLVDQDVPALLAEVRRLQARRADRQAEPPRAKNLDRTG